MEIHVFDWAIYFFAIYLYIRYDKDTTLEGLFRLVVFTVIYWLIFAFINWVDMINWVLDNVSFVS